MNIKITNRLTQTEKDSVISLQTICNKVDGLKSEAYLSNEINYTQNLPCFFLGFENNKLIAFLTAFFPENIAAEITAFVHPDYRKQGCFTKLLKCAIEVYSGASIPKLQFCVEHGSISPESFSKRFGNMPLDRSEFTLNIKEYDVPFEDNPLKLVYVNRNNIELFRPYLTECYDYDDINLMDVAVSSRDRLGFTALDGDMPVGFFFLLNERGKTIIHGVAIRKALRGMGYGKMLMDHAVRESLKIRSCAELDVDTNNPAALHIYKSMGFKEKLRIDYYDYDLN